MRIKMLQTVSTVGQMLLYDKVYDLQEPLALALVARGQAEDTSKPPTPPVEIAATRPKIVEPKPEEPSEELDSAKKAELAAAKKKRAAARKKAARKKAAGKKPAVKKAAGKKAKK